MHIIFWLEEVSYMTPKEFDQFFFAELPYQYLSEKDSTMDRGAEHPIAIWKQC